MTVDVCHSKDSQTSAASAMWDETVNVMYLKAMKAPDLPVDSLIQLNVVFYIKNLNVLLGLCCIYSHQ